MAQASAIEKLAAATVAEFERREGRPNAKFDLSNVELVDESNQKLDWDIFTDLTSAPMTLTITGASSVKIVVEDPKGELLNDPVFANWMFKQELVSKSSAKVYTGRKITDSSKSERYGEEDEEEWILPERPIDLNLDGTWFRLSGFTVDKTELTLSFEDRIACILREEVGTFVTVNRGDFTRAQFIEKLAKTAERIRHMKIPVFIPEAKIVQLIETPTSGETAGDLKSSSARALSPTDGITVKGQPASATQLQILSEALEVAVELKAPFKAQVALIIAIITENVASNPNPGTPTDEGVLSLLATTAAAYHISPYSVPAVSSQFLSGPGFTGSPGAIDLARVNTHLSASEIAGVIQGGEYERSGAWTAEAEHMVRVYGSTESTEGLDGATVPGPYAFSRGVAETTWDCMQRLASEVSWYCFVRDNTLWYVSGNFLMAQQSSMHVQKGEAGVDWVNPDIELGARDGTAEVVVEGRAVPFTAISGNAVDVARVGPANGKWVVTTIAMDLDDHSDAIKVTLQKPLPARPEPASGSGAVGVGELEGSAARGAEPGTALAAFYAANSLSEMQLPYLWGGGHKPGALALVKKGGEGLDCSGSTSWVLHEAGMYPGTTGQTSTAFESWGDAGEGKEMTVWANAEHVYIEFKIPGHAHARGDTVSPGDVGFRLQSVWPPPEGTAGFTPRHWPGT